MASQAPGSPHQRPSWTIRVGVVVALACAGCAIAVDPSLRDVSARDRITYTIEVDAVASAPDAQSPPTSDGSEDTQSPPTSDGAPGTECITGRQEVLGPCGRCGTSSRSCNAAGRWDAARCDGEGVCSPGQTEYQCCAGQAYSSQPRTCGTTCQWGGYGTCVRESVEDPASPTPANNASGVSRMPSFSWALPQPGAQGFYSNLYLWSCSARTDACLIGFGSLGNATTPVTAMSFSNLTVWHASTFLPALECNHSYYWVVTPGTTCANTHITTPAAVWSFVTGC